MFSLSFPGEAKDRDAWKDGSDSVVAYLTITPVSITIHTNPELSTGLVFDKNAVVPIVYSYKPRT